MTLEPISFDLGQSPAAAGLVLADASGLAPLPIPMPPEDSLRRFSTAMGGDATPQDGNAAPVGAQASAAVASSLRTVAPAEAPVASAESGSVKPDASPTAVPPAVASAPHCTAVEAMPLPEAPSRPMRQCAAPSEVPLADEPVGAMPTVPSTTPQPPDMVRPAAVSADVSPNVPLHTANVPAHAVEVPRETSIPVPGDTARPVQDSIPVPAIEAATVPQNGIAAKESAVSAQTVPAPTAEAAESRPSAVSEAAAQPSVARVLPKKVLRETPVSEPEAAPVLPVQMPVAFAAPAVDAPVAAPAPSDVSASAARTEAIVEVVNGVIEAVASQILVTPSIVRGEGEMLIRLKQEVLDGSEIRLTSSAGTLAVSIDPATVAAAQLAGAALPRLEEALAGHSAAFHHVTVAVKKGRISETD